VTKELEFDHADSKDERTRVGDVSSEEIVEAKTTVEEDIVYQYDTIDSVKLSETREDQVSVAKELEADHTDNKDEGTRVDDVSSGATVETKMTAEEKSASQHETSDSAKPMKAKEDHMSMAKELETWSAGSVDKGTLVGDVNSGSSVKACLNMIQLIQRSRRKQREEHMSVAKEVETDHANEVTRVDDADANQLKKLAALSSPVSDAASSCDISEIESRTSSDALSPRNGVTEPVEAKEEQEMPPKTSFCFAQTCTQSKPLESNLFADFASGKSVEAPQVDNDTPEKDEPPCFDIGNAVGQPNVKSKLPSADNPFATFAVDKAPSSSSSSCSFKSAASTSTQADAKTALTSTFSFGSTAPASTSHEGRDEATFTFVSSAPTASFSFAKSKDTAHETPVSSPSRSSGLLESPKDKAKAKDME